MKEGGGAHACWFHQGGEGGVGRRASEACEKRTLAGSTKEKEGKGGGCARSARLPTTPKEEKGKGSTRVLVCLTEELK